MPQPVLFDYFQPARSDLLIVVSPDTRISGHAIGYKQRLERCVGAYDGLHSRPHFTLARVVCLSNRERAIIRAIGQHCIPRISPERVRLDRFRKFETSGTIYLEPVDKEFFRGIVRHLYYAIHGEGLAHRRHCRFTLEPHLTIGKKLSGPQLEKGWSMFSAMHYQDSFFAEHITVLKRVDPRTNRHEVVHQFTLR